MLHAAVAAAAFIPTPHPGGDNATYIALARSLIERHAYLSIWDPGAPPHTRFPPLFPAALALLRGMGVHSWVHLKGVLLLTSATFVGVSFLWMRRRIGQTAAVALGIYLAIAPGLLDASHWILSDVPFALLVIAALLCFDRDRERISEEPERETSRRRVGYLVGGLVFTLMAAFTRTAALPLLLAVALSQLVHRNFRRLGLFALVVVPPIGAWTQRNRLAGGDGYGAEFLAVNPYEPGAGTVDVAGLLDRVGANVTSYLHTHLPTLLFGRAAPYAVTGAAAVVILALIGYALRMRRPGVAELFLPGYVALVLLWSSVGATERFLLPVLPLLLVYAAGGLASLTRWAGRYAWAAAPILAILLILGAAPGTTPSDTSGRRSFAAPQAFCVLHVATRDRATALLRIEAPTGPVASAGQPLHPVSLRSCR